MEKNVHPENDSTLYNRILSEYLDQFEEKTEELLIYNEKDVIVKMGFPAYFLLTWEFINWAKNQGCTEFASDCELSNTESQAFHQAVGFEEANRIVAYVRKI